MLRFFPIRDARKAYLFGAAVAALAALIEAFAPGFDPFVIFLGAVSLSASFAGAGPAVLAAMFGFLFVLLWPAHPLRLGAGLHVAIPLGIYAMVAVEQILLFRWLTAALAETRELGRRMMAELETQKVRFQELQHRVGNHMQVIASILTLQKAKVRSDPGSALAALDETRERVVNMSRAHRRLYDPASAGKNARQHLEELCADLAVSASPHRVLCAVAPDVSIEDPLKLMTISLFVDEAINNSLKHAFRGDEAGTISVELEREGDFYIVKVGDTGRGLALGADPAAAPGLGFKIMQALAGQLGGRLDFANADGFTIRVTFAA